MLDLSYASREKVTPDTHDVIDEAIREEAEVNLFITYKGEKFTHQS